MNVSKAIVYVGVNDRKIEVFEGQYAVPGGMSYNSYAILDKKTAIMDSVDKAFENEWLDNVEKALQGGEPDYLIVQHMEPDHSASVAAFADKYKNAVIVSSAKAFAMMKNYFGTDFAERRLVVGEGDTLALGEHTLRFFSAPMVHWPEVFVSYEEKERALFSADAFGKFGTTDTEEEWDCEARRYYFGIVGKYGVQVQMLLKKLAGLKIDVVCPLHGPLLREDVERYVRLYDIWSSYGVESDGVVIAYTSVYGNTEKAVRQLEERLISYGCKSVRVHDLARCDTSEAVEDAFRFGKLVLATTTYNGGVFPYMHTFLTHLSARNFQKRTVGLIENGSWAPMAAREMQKLLETCKDVTYTQASVKILSSLSEENYRQIDALAKELCST